MQIYECFCLRSLLQVDDELEIKAYYAGHVLGAAMVLIKVGSESVVYTVRTPSGFEGIRSESVLN